MSTNKFTPTYRKTQLLKCHEWWWMLRHLNVLVCYENVTFTVVSFTFLVICLVGTENKATLSRKADMRLQLRSLAWHGVVVVVRWTQRWGQSDVRMDEWKWTGGHRELSMNSGKKCDEPQADIMSLKHNRYGLLVGGERMKCERRKGVTGKTRQAEWKVDRRKEMTHESWSEVVQDGGGEEVKVRMRMRDLAPAWAHSWSWGFGVAQIWSPRGHKQSLPRSGSGQYPAVSHQTHTYTHKTHTQTRQEARAQWVKGR